MTNRPTRAQRERSAFLVCRSVGHAWFIIPGERGTLGGDPLWLRCERCMMERHDSISFSTGDVMSRHYIQPAGYKDAFRTEGDQAPSRQDFRRMLGQELGLASERRRAG